MTEKRVVAPLREIQEVKNAIAAYDLFSEKFDLSKTVIAAVFIAWILGSLLPWGIVVKNGIKNQKTIQM